MGQSVYILSRRTGEVTSRFGAYPWLRRLSPISFDTESACWCFGLFRCLLSSLLRCLVCILPQGALLCSAFEGWRYMKSADAKPIGSLQLSEPPWGFNPRLVTIEAVVSQRQFVWTRFMVFRFPFSLTADFLCVTHLGRETLAVWHSQDATDIRVTQHLSTENPNSA